MFQERGEAAATVTAAPRPQRASLPMPCAPSSSASSSSSFMRPGHGNLPAVSVSRDHPVAPTLAHAPPLPAPSPSPSPPLPTSAVSAPTASRDHLFFSLVPHADMQSMSSTQSADYRHRGRGGGGGGSEGGDRPSEYGSKRRRTTTSTAAARSSASSEPDGGDHERWQALQIVGRACQIFRDDDAVRRVWNVLLLSDFVRSTSFFGVMFFTHD
jgi:hypothetical protein